MKTVVKILIGIVAAAAISAACSRQDPVAVDGAPLSFGIAGQTKTDNRKTSITEFTVKGFGADGEWFPQTTVTVPSGTYGKYRWRIGDTHTFFAFSNLPQSIATASIASTGVTLSYTSVPKSQADQQDILLGSYSGRGNNGEATLHFHHPLASVAFKIGAISDVKSIDGITLDGVYGSGSVTLGETSGTPAFSWTHGATLDGVSQTFTVTTFTSGAALGYPFILIPQEAASGVTVKMAVTHTDNKTQTVSCALTGVSWKSGQTSIYKVDYTPSKGLNFTSSVELWGTGVTLDRTYDY